MKDDTAGIIRAELSAHGLDGAEYSLIREKDGVIVARVDTGDGPRVLKILADEPSRREISNYRILISLGVPTLRVFGLTSRSILMEDIEASPALRLGREEDIHDPEVIRALARWYRELHGRGAEYVKAHGAGMYDEWDLFTEENIGLLMKALGGACKKPLERLKNRYPELRSRMDAAPKTLCYNDFYFTNMAVSKDKTEALMFDYNYLGKGCPINDFTNVAYWFTEEEKALFLKEYGGMDMSLIGLQETISPVIDLVSALKRGIFPDWAEEARQRLIADGFGKSGEPIVFLETNDLKTDEISLRLDRTFGGDPVRKWVPAYYFDIVGAGGVKVGFCDLRIGHSEGLYYGGNIGYTVYEPYRGNRYALKACRLLMKLAKRHELEYVYITCRPDNIPSRKTCEGLGGELIDIAELPEDHDLRVNDGHTHECVYCFDLNGC